MFKNTRTQGAVAVGSAIEYFLSKELPVCVPVAEIQRFDLVVEMDGALARVECKHSTYTRGKSYEVMLETKGGNTSWSGLKSKVCATDCDYVFILAGGRRWLIPASEVAGKSTISVGNKAWSAYEI